MEPPQPPRKFSSYLLHPRVSRLCRIYSCSIRPNPDVLCASDHNKKQQDMKREADKHGTANCRDTMRRASHLEVSGAHHRADVLLVIGSAAVGDCRMYLWDEASRYDKKDLPRALRRRQTLRLHRARNVREHPSISGATATIHQSPISATRGGCPAQRVSWLTALTALLHSCPRCRGCGSLVRLERVSQYSSLKLPHGLMDK